MVNDRISVNDGRSLSAEISESEALHLFTSHSTVPAFSEPEDVGCCAAGL